MRTGVDPVRFSNSRAFGARAMKVTLWSRAFAQTSVISTEVMSLAVTTVPAHTAIGAWFRPRGMDIQDRIFESSGRESRGQLKIQEGCWARTAVAS